MRFFMPIILILGIFITSCSKDEDISNEISQKDKLAGDSLYSIYQMMFNKPSELNITAGRTYNHGEETKSLFLGFRNGDPWIAIYDNNKKLLNEHTEALPDSIKANKSLNRVVEFSSYFYKDAILIAGIIRDGTSPTVPVGEVASYLYLFDINDNSIKKRIYDYGYLSEITLYENFTRWYDGSFLTSNWEKDKYFIIDNNLDELYSYIGVINPIASEGTYHFPNYIRGLYVTSMSEYFSLRIFETTLEINKWSTSAILISPKYPELPYYSYLKGLDEVDIIERPSNYVRFESAVSTIEDLGNQLKISLTGMMLLSDVDSERYFEKQVNGSVLVDKKTGNVISK